MFGPAIGGLLTPLSFHLNHKGWNEVFWEEDFSEKLGDVKEVYAKYFSKEDGAKYQGLPMGIAADTVCK